MAEPRQLFGFGLDPDRGPILVLPLTLTSLFRSGALMVSSPCFLEPPKTHLDFTTEGSRSIEDLRDWFAVFTCPQNERSVVKHLDWQRIESFLPTFETVHVWKNRQRVKMIQPLFPTYVFVKMHLSERLGVLRSPGVLKIIGNRQGPIPISTSEIEFLRSDFCRERTEPFGELVLGEKVRIKSGSMRGVRGTLVRKKSGLRFVLTLQLINQNAAIEVAADELERVPD
jgi:transcription antitermination factor NusG